MKKILKSLQLAVLINACALLTAPMNLSACDKSWSHDYYCEHNFDYGLGPVLTKDITSDIPEISLGGYQRIADVAQYKQSDWSHAIGIARGISVAEAKAIADNNPEITFFFYTKGLQMVLEREDGTYRLFQNGDAVFFKGEPWWGSAPGLADGYIKR